MAVKVLNSLLYLCPESSPPLESTKHPSDIQEERRLFYVGMTRAREELILTCGAEPSSFLSELSNTIKRETVKRREQPAEQLSLF